jgi:hypothetical protein
MHGRVVADAYDVGIVRELPEFLGREIRRDEIGRPRRLANPAAVCLNRTDALSRAIP